jgi:PAS domain S-box-containing protein
MTEINRSTLGEIRRTLLRRVWLSAALSAALLMAGFIVVVSSEALAGWPGLAFFGALILLTLGLVIWQLYGALARPAERAERQMFELSGQLRKAESGLFDEAQRAQAIWENVVDGLVMMDAKGHITAANPAACWIFGHQEADLIGKNVSMLAGGDDRARHDQYVKSYIETGDAKIIGRPREVVGRRSDGSEFPVDLAVAEMQAEEGRHFIGVLRDLTERAALEEQLRHAQKLEAVGQLTGGIAHDFNNLLAVIKGNLGLLIHDLNVGDGTIPDEAMELSEGALHAAERGADLTKGLLAFSRKQALRPQEFDVDEVVEGMEGLLRRTLGEAVDLRLKLKRQGWHANADPSQLESAVLNLAVNARDALIDGGRLLIETQDITLDEHYSASHEEVEPGDYVMVIVSDDGPGMSPEILSRVLEPFFTTKEVGQGSGLGLSMIYGFAKQSGGHLSIYSEVGEGTTVKLYLPKAKVGAAKDSGPAEIEKIYLRGHERILVVEDDEALRVTVRRILSRLGYNVLLAEDGPQALEVLRSDEEIDLLLTDVILPKGMNGPQLVGACKELRPNLSVLYMSGYTKEAIIQSGRLDHADSLLNKPFSPQELGVKVREILSQD